MTILKGRIPKEQLPQERLFHPLSFKEQAANSKETTEDPQGLGANPQLQSVTTPIVVGALPEFHTVTMVVPLHATQNPDTSLPLEGRNRLLYNYGLEPNKRYYEWYTDEDKTTDVDTDVNHHHHHPGKEPIRRSNPPEFRRPSGGGRHQQNYEERIQVHEQSIIQDSMTDSI